MLIAGNKNIYSVLSDIIMQIAFSLPRINTNVMIYS